jgi:hypothetical protein
VSEDQPLLPAKPAPAKPAPAGRAPLRPKPPPGRRLSEAEDAALRRIQLLAYWLDDRFRIPFLNRRIGLDGLLGLVPGVGDAVTTLLSIYVMAEAWRLGVPTTRVVRMAANLGIDSLVGAIPLMGDLFDIAFKANRRNIKILHDHLDPERRR